MQKRHLGFLGLVGLSLLGCGGSASLQNGGTVHVLAAADGDIYQHLSQQFRMVQSMAISDSAAMILIDGDHVSPALLGSTSGLKAAADKGTPIVVLDGTEELHQAVSEAIRADGAPTVAAKAVAFLKAPPEKGGHFRVLMIPGGEQHVITKAVEHLEGDAIFGNATTSEHPTPVDGATVQRFASMVSGKTPLGDPSPIPLPAGVKTTFTTFHVLNGGPESNLNDQNTTRQLWYSFQGVLNESSAGNFRQHLIMRINGELNSGPLSKTGWDGGDVMYHGWPQYIAQFNNSIYNKTSKNEDVNMYASIFSSGYNGNFNNHFLHLIGYRDSAQNYLPWLMSFDETLSIPGWDEDDNGQNNSANFYLYQREPFNGLAEDIEHIWGPHGEFKPYTAASEGALPVALTAMFTNYDRPVSGQIKVYFASKRKFIKQGAIIINLQPIPIPTGLVEIGDGSPNSIGISFRDLVP